MPASVTGAIRDARHEDTAAIVEVLADAFADGVVARWLDPDDGRRPVLSRGYFAGVVESAFAHGLVHVAVETAEVIGAALWLPYDGAGPDAGSGGQEAGDLPDGIPADVGARLAILDGLLAERYPARPHHHLAFVGVSADRQKQGIGGNLLDHYHAVLDTAGLPAYLEANDPRNRALYLRHRYVDLGEPIRLPDTTPIWPMWRDPGL
jgi:GNAT superfamily N-acetyltransferase